MGPWDPNGRGKVPDKEGRGSEDRPGDPTQVVDHNGQSRDPDAKEIPLPWPVDEDCINRCLDIGSDTGPWGPTNQCHTFVDDCLKRCRVYPTN